MLQSHLSCQVNSSDPLPDFNSLSVPDICQLAKTHSISVPGRPIISGIGTLTEGLSGYVDSILNPLLHKIPSYLQDSTHFLRIINSMGTLPTEALLVTMDVTSLYTNIPHEEGVRACKEFIYDHTSDQTLSCDISKLIFFILKNNFFTFNGNFFHQIKGTAMGTKMAPSYANIFMHKLEVVIIT